MTWFNNRADPDAGLPTPPYTPPIHGATGAGTVAVAGIAIVAFSGTKGSGKSTAAGLLEHFAKANHNVTRLGFADPIRSYMDKAYPGWLQDKEKYRPIAQEIGRELRAADENTLIRTLLGRIRMLERQWPNSPDLFIVDDLRCWNEAVALRNRGALLIRLTGTTDDPDITEHGLDSWIDWDATATGGYQAAAKALALLNKVP